METTINLSNNMQDENLAIKVMLMVITEDELPFLKLSIPRYLAAFPAATLYVYSSSAAVNGNAGYISLLHEYANNKRVVWLDAFMECTADGIPAGSASAITLLDSMHIACAIGNLSAKQKVLRVMPYSIPINATKYYDRILDGKAEFMVGCSCNNIPFSFCNYFMTSSMCFSILRMLSFLPSMNRPDIVADIFMQGFLFSMFCEAPAVYSMLNKAPGAYAEHAFDYTKQEDQQYLEFCSKVAGTLYFSKADVPAVERVAAAKKVLEYLDKKELPE